MLHKLIDLNLDLKRLADEGYHLEVQGDTSLLLIHSVPYVASDATVREDGLLVMALAPGQENTLRPTDHTAYFKGEGLCDAAGSPLASIINSEKTQTIGGIEVSHYLSANPGGSYKDSYHKVKAYVSLISRHAKKLRSQVTAQVNKQVVILDDPLFHYADSSATLSGVAHLNEKLAQPKVAIVGLGGTGTYVFDLIVKTRVSEIHLFDGDVFLANNAFRAPGAASLEEVSAAESKVEFLTRRYAQLRKSGVVPHPYFVKSDNVEQLREMSFVFLCVDSDEDKKVIVDHLRGWDIPFIDVGMGINLTEDDKLTGMIRTTLVTPTNSDHTARRILYSDAGVDEMYNHNIQIADLNALNAVLAVMKWKKHLGYYADSFHEHTSFFMLSGNRIINKDFAG